MNLIKRILGLFWIAAGPLALIYLLKTATREIDKHPFMETMIQWGVFVAVFIPIAVGIVLFGYYALKGEYDDPFVGE